MAGPVAALCVLHLTHDLRTRSLPWPRFIWTLSRYFILEMKVHRISSLPAARCEGARRSFLAPFALARPAMRVARGVPLLLLAFLVATRAQPSAQIAAVEGEERRVAITLMLTCRSYLALDSSVAGQHTVNHNAVIYGK